MYVKNQEMKSVLIPVHVVMMQEMYENKMDCRFIYDR